MIFAYKILITALTPFLWLYLLYRAWQGKEIKSRLNEKRGIASLPRPKGDLIWIHAASVGEAQAALILIEKLHQRSPNLFFLVTSVTVTSSKILNEKLPIYAVHQFVPIDHPQWVKRFLDFWKPNTALFLESEIWPAILLQLNKKNIPAVLINGRLSDRSFKNWMMIKPSSSKIFSTFDLILAQSDKDTNNFKQLGGNVKTTGNIKLNASPLPFDNAELDRLKKSISNRPVWLYASTHEGEEELAGRMHISLKEDFPDLLTIIVPRHPQRADDIKKTLKIMGLTITCRNDEKKLPATNDDIYLANTLGELGLFYRLSPLSMIGRSFSMDGGGGHNPIEAAQLNSVVLTGPHIQYQHNLFYPMFEKQAAIQTNDEDELRAHLKILLSNEEKYQEYLDKTHHFIASLNNIIDDIVNDIYPFLPQKGTK